MGTSTSVGEFVGKMHAAGRAVGDAPSAGVREAAMVGKAILLTNLPSRTMRNVGRGARLNARFDFRGAGATATALLRYTGPAHLLNNATSPHEIAPRRKQALAFPDGGVRSQAVDHPGTAGKQFFQRSKPQVSAAFRTAMTHGTSRALARVF